ncbi:Peptidase [Sphingomonas sp. EC-HK361]|uniref:PepSY-associated TM helix domain-containing protein n=1 Tax=Sphingomonas sp. EC-HK361 TaxID=2038397 RepID=UPI00125BD1BC|nr:PepSY-associated TM helix domain-containing protein [Sphingomonas sp. EC-HK361]VVT13188.1 Peptidase [Sphingomonas sp. EC-HK361]
MTKIGARKAWFQVHKWIGLILAVLIIPISLTGAALVWHDALDKTLNAGRFATSGAVRLAPAAYLSAARARVPGAVAQLTLGTGDEPVAVSFAGDGKPQAGPPARTTVYLDPPTAHVLDVANSNAGIVRVMHRLHGSLMVPGVGRQIVGWIGVAMLISSFSGLWLWWPTIGSWVRGLRWRRHRNLDTNLHHLFGFWIALPLFVLSLTGAWISFPAFFGALSVQAPQRGGGPDRAAMMRAKPLATPALGVDQVVAKASAMAGGRAQAITWPTTLKPDWTVSFGQRSVTVADDTGIAAEVPRREQAGIARLMRRIHDGTGMGPIWQVIIFLGGLLPAILAVTGIIMWWRARSWKGDLKRRQQARAAA